MDFIVLVRNLHYTFYALIGVWLILAYFNMHHSFAGKYSGFLYLFTENATIFPIE